MDGDKILEEVKVFGALNAQMEQLVSLENEFLRGATARILLAVGSDTIDRCGCAVRCVDAGRDLPTWSCSLD